MRSVGSGHLARCMRAPTCKLAVHCTLQAPTTAIINEDLTNPGVNVSQVYAYCVQVGPWLVSATRGANT